MKNYDRRYFEAIADELLDHAAAYQSDDGTRFNLPSPRPSLSGADMDGLEGFARTFLLAACRIPYAEPERRTALVERYRRGLKVGADPKSSAPWPRLRSEPDGHQSQVEATSIALGLWETRRFIWDTLDDETKQLVADYLGDIAHVRCTWNNWYLFRVIILSFLEAVDMRAPDGLVEEALSGMEALYRTPGWYVDGFNVEGTTFDYYTGWADHTYTLLWARIAGENGDREATDEYRRRAADYVSTLTRMIGKNGAPLFQGRSLLYRNAITAPLWAMELTGGSPLPPGQVRQLGGRVLDYFADNGAFETGLPSLGWTGEHLPIVQAYSGGSSPFWLSKGFLGLLLPPDHPVWTAPAEALPIDDGDFVQPVPAPNLILHGTAADGIVRALNGGIAKDATVDDGHYNRLAFSTRTAPWTSAPEPGDRAIDQVVDNWAGYIGGDGRPSRFGAIRALPALDPNSPTPTIRHYFATHLHEPDQADEALERIVPAVYRESFVRGSIEYRVLRIVRRAPLTLAATGYALSDSDPLEILSGHRWIAARAADGTLTAILDLTGMATLTISSRGSSAFGDYTALPVATWSDAVAAQLCGTGTNRGSAEFSLGVVLGVHDPAELDLRLREFN